MSYTKTTWANGDTITAEKLNNAESGIEEINMSYEKQTWSNGDTITAEKLNYMENGISDGGSSDFTTANVTINAIGFSGQVQISHTEDFGMSSSVYIESGQSASVTAVLYKGICESWSADGDATAVSGDATIDDGMAYISGDCTITFGE